MFKNDYQIVSPERHADTRIKTSLSFENFANSNNVELLANEFPVAASEYPIMFLRNPEIGGFRAVAITGIDKDENLFIRDNQWTGRYIPGSVGLYPFRLQRKNSPVNNDIIEVDLLVDEACTRINKTEGELLFNEGKETPILAKYRVGITRYFKDLSFSNQFITYLADNELLIERSLTININGVNKELFGMFAIDPDKINSLSDEKFIELRTRGYLQLIYAQLNSFFHFDELRNRKQALEN